MDHPTLPTDTLRVEVERLRAANRALTEENRLLRQSRDASQLGEQRYRMLAENTLDLISETSQHGVYTYVSPNHFDVLGYRPKELLGQNFSTLIHPEDVNAVVEKFSECIVVGVPYVATFRARHKDGSWRWLETAGKPLEIATAPGAPAYQGSAVFVLRDVTERRDNRRTIATESDRLAVTLRSIAEGVVATDTAGLVVQANDAALRLTGLTRGEFIGQRIGECLNFLDENSRQPLLNPVEGALREGVECALPVNGHALLRSRSGVEFIVAGSAAPIRDEEHGSQGAVLVFRNITDRRRTEQELLKLNKQDSLGQLAARIAHDFNNLLTVILGNLSLAKILLEPGDAALRRLVDTEKACLRAKDLTRQLLAFARGGLPVKKPLSLEPLVRESARLIMQDSAIPYRLHWAVSLPCVNADAEQLHQLLYELLTNAVQATPSDGTIHLWGQTVRLDGQNTLPLPEGDYVCLSVRDEGVGIPDAHLTRIFEPFFTTKENARGLGLATCFLIARNHDGFMTVDSTPGMGTDFHLYLPALPAETPAPLLDRPPLATYRAPAPGQRPPPAAAPEPESEPEPEPAAPAVRLTAGRILVMDDEETICELASETLTRNGYEVHTSFDGEEAIAKYHAAREAGQPFDVVILDLTVRSGLGGLETITRLRQEDPAVKAIVSSGYSQDPIMSRYREHGFCGVVSKPYSISEMLQEVEQAMADSV